MSVGLGALPKGHQFPPSAFELSPQWVREYVAATEDAAVARLAGDLVPPMAVAALAVRALLDQAKLPPGAVHLGQETAFLRPVRVGERLSARAQVAGRGERHGWTLMSIDLEIQDEGRRPVMTGRATLTMPAGPGLEPPPEG